MKSIINVFLLIISVNLFAQNNKIDSLQQRLNITHGKERILTLNELATAYWYVDPLKSISFANESLKLQEQEKFYDIKARTLNIIGVSYYILNNYDIAYEYYNKCISAARKYHSDEDSFKALKNIITLHYFGYKSSSPDLIKNFNNYFNSTILRDSPADFYIGLYYYIGICHLNQTDNSSMIQNVKKTVKGVKNISDFQAAILANEGYSFQLKLSRFEAISKYDQALKLTQNKYIKVSILISVGKIYFENQKYKESIKYHQEALQIVNLSNDSSLKSFLLTIKTELGAAYLQIKDYKNSLKYFKEVEPNIAFFIDADKGLVYNNLGVAYMSLDSLEKASTYIAMASEIINKLKLDNYKLGFLNTKAELFERQKDQRKLSIVMSEISSLIKNVKDFYILSDSYKLLSNYYETSGDYRKSIDYLKKWIVVNDSIKSKDFSNKIGEFQFRYETEKKNQQIATQKIIIKQKNLFATALISSSGAILIALVIIFLLYKRKNRAYKHLVHQTYINANIGNLPQNKKVNNRLEESLASQIETSIDEQIKLKIFIDPNITLESLAFKCNTNRTYLSQFIHEKYNMHFNAFVNKLRINEAVNILSANSNDFPLKELYQRLGYNSYSVFNEAFKKYTGVTPAFYLKAIMDLASESNELE